MLNGVNLNYIIVLLVTGAFLLAAIYHTILFAHRRTKLLGSYSAYLWSTLVFCVFRTIYFANSENSSSVLNLDEIFQMIAFGFYIRFAAVALDLDDKVDQHAVAFTRITPYVIALYIAVNTYIINAEPYSHTAYFMAKIIVRGYLLCMGLMMLLVVLRKRQSLFYNYLAAGAISMIVFGLISSSLHLVFKPESFVIGPLSWLMAGFFSDVVFFSSAIGYRIRQEHREREESLQELLKKEAELQQKELEKMKAVYETREEERLRIARDLHDDMGSTLSSIGIYSKVVSSYLYTDQQKAEEYLEKIQNNTRQLMENTTDLIWSLQTNYGESESIFRRMQRAAVEMLSSANISPQVTIPFEELPALQIEAQKNCWLIFKEAINNVCKYSNAKTCWVTISLEGSQLVLSVKDDGVGFKEPKSGNGLKNMLLRSAALGGECMVESSNGNGTLVKAVMPVERNSFPKAAAQIKSHVE
jgi:signal transduction histidine kinase